MKKLFLICLVSLFALQASAQYYGHYGYGNRFNSGSSGEYLPTGYRGMVELGNGACFDGYYANQFSTTHGYQFNKHIFWGAYLGFGLGCCGSEFVSQIGTDFRTYFMKTRVTPYLGVRVAFEYCPYCGPLPYLGGDVGVRFALKNKMGLTLSVNVGGDFECDGYGMVKLGFEF